MRGPRGFGTGSWRQSDPLVHRPLVSGVSLWVGDANAYLTLSFERDVGVRLGASFGESMFQTMS